MSVLINGENLDLFYFSMDLILKHKSLTNIFNEKPLFLRRWLKVPKKRVLLLVLLVLHRFFFYNFSNQPHMRVS